MKKKAILIAFMFIVIVSMSILCLFYSRESKNQKLVLEMLIISNKELLEKKKLLYDQLVDRDINPTSQYLLLLKKMDEVSNYCNDVLSSKKYYQFSIDSLHSIMNDNLYDIHSDDFIQWNLFNQTAKKITFSKCTSKSEEYFIHLCLHIILEKCLEKYRETALMTGWGECLVIPKSDTVKMGEFYEAEVRFNVKDLGETYTIVFLPDKIVKIKGIYKEMATKQGKNTRQGLISFSNADVKDFYYPVEFSYYVK